MPDKPGWTVETWPGGTFMTQQSTGKRNGFLWEGFIAWVQNNPQWQWRNARFVEEYQPGTEWLGPETALRQYMPVEPRRSN